MPTRFLSAAELDSLQRFPEAIAPDDLAAHFTLTADDLAFVRDHRGAPSRLGVALQLCALRLLGFVPADLADAPAEALDYLAAQLDVPARAVFDYGLRGQTRREHHIAVRDHLGFQRADEAAMAGLAAWLAERALEHDRPTRLFGLACEQLRSWRIERPAPDRLVRLVATARERAHVRTHELLADQLTARRARALDALLVPTGRPRRTPLVWLRARPTAVSAGALRRELAKLAYLREQLGAHELDLAALPPNRRAWLAQLGRRSTAQALGRLEPVRRHPVLAAFAVEMLAQRSDDALEVFDRALGAADRGAQRERDELTRRSRRQTTETVRRFVQLGRLVLEARKTGIDPLVLIERQIGLDRLEAELAQAERLAADAPDTHLDLLAAHGHQLRPLLAELLAALSLRAGPEARELTAALELLRGLQGTGCRWLPGHVPTGFIARSWRPLVVDAERGRVDRRGYELAVAYELRSALRAGRVWVPGSRRHADPTSHLLPADRWRRCARTSAPPSSGRSTPARGSTSSPASSETTSSASTASWPSSQRIGSRASATGSLRPPRSTRARSSSAPSSASRGCSSPIC